MDTVDWLKILAIALAVAFIIVLLRASRDIGGNPYLRERIHKDLGFRFPEGLSSSARQQLMDRFGVAPGDRGRPVRYVIVLLIGFLLFVWLYS